MELIVRMTKVNPWTGLIKWSNCFDFISSCWPRSDSRYTGLKADKARELEQKMGKAEGELDHGSTFWDTFAIKIGKKELVINTDRPEGELQYLFLLGHKRVANGIDKITPSTDYVLINKEVKEEQINKVKKVNGNVKRALEKMSLKKMRKCLRLLEIKAETMSIE